MKMFRRLLPAFVVFSLLGIFAPVYAVNVPPSCPEGLDFHEASGHRFRRISLDGLPMVAAKGQAKAETDQNSEETYVDSLTMQLRHDTSDVYISLPGGELALGAQRSISTEIWSDEPGEKPSHTLPYERPFGHGWSSGLGAHIKVTTEIFPAEDPENPCPVKNPPNRIIAVDENGSATDFLQLWVQDEKKPDGSLAYRLGFLPLPSNRTSQDQFLNRLEYDKEADKYVLTRKFGTKVFYEPVTNLVPIVINLSEDGKRQRIINYYRASKVEDRYGNRISYQYDAGNHTLTPDRVVSGAVSAGAAARTLTITRSGAQVSAITDPRGNTWTFTYDTAQSLDGQSLKLLSSVSDPLGQRVEYQYELTSGIISPPSKRHDEDTDTEWFHVNLSSITSGVTSGDVQGPAGAVAWQGAAHTTTIQYGWDHTVRSWDYIQKDKSLALYDPAVTRPRIVTASLLADGSGAAFAASPRSLANPVQMSASAASNGASPGSVSGFREWVVTDAEEKQRTFFYSDPALYDSTEIKDLLQGEDDNPRHPSYSLLWRQCDMSHPDGVNEVAQFDDSASLADKKVTDYSGNVTTYTYGERYNIFQVQFPDLYEKSPSLQAINHPLFTPKFPEPEAETNALPATTYFRYYSSGIPMGGNVSAADLAKLTSPASRVMTEITDAEGRKTVYALDPNTGNRLNEKVYDAGGTLVKETTFSYGHPTFKSFVTETRVKNALRQVAANDAVSFTDLVTTSTPDTFGNSASSTIDPSGLAITTTSTYDANGNLISSTDARGFTSTMSYDARNRLVASTLPASTVNAAVAYPAATLRIGYDPSSNKVWETDANGKLSYSAYDARNRLVATVRDMDDSGWQQDGGITAGDIRSTISYNNVGTKIASTDPRGTVTTLSVDDLQRPVSTTVDPGGLDFTTTFEYGANSGGWAFRSDGFKPTKTTDPRGYVSTASYDGIYRQTAAATEFEAPGDGLGGFATTTTSYDKVGNMISSTDPLGQVTVTSYDAQNRPVSSTTAHGTALAQTTTMDYTPAMQWRTTAFVGTALERVTETDYDAAGRAVRVWSPDPATGQVSRTTPADPIQGSPMAESVYDANGNVISTIDPLGRVTDTTYDSRNRPVKIELPAVIDASDPLNPVANHRPTSLSEYDQAGNPVKSTDPRGTVSTMVYDSAYRVISSTSAIGTPVAATTASTYDANNNVLTVTDANGNLTRNIYDAVNRLSTSATNPATGQPAADPVGSPNADDLVVINSYDPAGNLLTVTDGEGRMTAFSYDGTNRKLSTTWDPGTPAEKSTVTVYNALLATSETNARGQSKSFTYDALHRVTDIAYSDRSADDRSMSYDLAGNLLAITYPNESAANQSLRQTTNSYDLLNRALTETSTGDTHTYSYDKAGNLVAVTYGGSGRSIATTYDALNRTLTVSETATVGATANITTFGYDRGGNQTLKSLPNSLREHRSFDALGRTLTIKTLTAGLIVSSVFDYSQATAGYPSGYDRAGNVLRILETYPTATQPAREVVNSYDHSYRLTAEVISVTGGDSTDTRYIYDKGNNRLQKRVSINNAAFVDHNYTFGTTADGFNSNQLKSYNRPDTNQIVELSYDADGSRASRVVKDASNVVLSTDTFTWDQDNRLIALNLNSGPPASQGEYAYLYDARTRRVLRDESGADGDTTRISFLGGTSVAEYDAADPVATATPQVEYIRANGMGGGIGSILYSQRGATLSTSHYNSRGDVVARANLTGIFTYTAAYEAFGTHDSETGSNPDRQQANTKEEDPTGLLNEGHRYRDLETGMFISRDPAGFVDGPNVYTYVGQNPWTGFDPEGLETKDQLEKQLETYDRSEQAVIDHYNKSDMSQAEKDKVIGSVREQYAADRKTLQDRIGKIENTARDMAKVYGKNATDFHAKLDDSHADVQELMNLLEHADNQGVKDGILDVAKGDYLSAAAAFGKGILVDRVLRRVPGLKNLLKKGNGKAMASMVPPPKIPNAFPNLSRVKPKTSVQGGGGLRKRWKDKKGNIYEWDSQHGTVEMYNKRGKHLGEFNAETGEQLKDAVSGRTVEP